MNSKTTNPSANRSDDEAGLAAADDEPITPLEDEDGDDFVDDEEDDAEDDEDSDDDAEDDEEGDEEDEKL